MKLALFAISVVLSSILISVSLAQDISVSASVDTKTVPLGEAIVLTIRVQGTQSIGAPELTPIEGFQSSFLGPSTQISIVNGQSSVSVSYRYSLVAMGTGQFTIPSIAVEYKGKTYRTTPIEVQVTSGSGARQSRTLTQEDLKEYIFFSIMTEQKTAYLNEGISVILRLHIRSGVDIRDIRYPTFPTTGFSVLPFGEPVQRQRTVDGILFRVIDFLTTVYPVTTGELAIGPAEVHCSLMTTRQQNRSHNRDPFFDSFFDQQVRYPMTIVSEPYKITVKPLPTEGRPASFGGAVGQYNFEAAAKPTSLKVGEPITLNMTVKGQGNIDTVSIPKIADLTQFKVYDPQVNVKKSGNSGEKTFEQVLIPTSASVKAIPEVQFSYFDPEAGQYRTQTKGPTPIQVAPSDTQEPLQILEIAKGKPVKREVLGKDIVYIKDEIGSVKHGDGNIYKNKGFLLLQLLPPVGFVATLLYQKRRDRFATDRTYARQYHAPRKARRGLAQARKMFASGQPQEFCSTIFRTVREYLGDRFNLPSAGITIEVVDSLRSQGVPEVVLEKLTTIFESCDRIRFGQSRMSEHEMNAILDLATESIKLLENTKLYGGNI